MSLLSKILLGLNLLGACGLTYLAAVTYGTRLTWQQAVFRYDRQINGLPLSDEDRDIQDQPLVEGLTGDVLKSVFNEAGQPVKTQIEEVQRVEGLVASRINSAGDQQKQLVEYAKILLPFAPTNLQRENLLTIRTHLADDKATDALKKQLAEAVALARTNMKADNKLKFPDALAKAVQVLGGDPARVFQEGVAKIMTADPAKSVDQAFNETVAAQHVALKGQLDGMFADALDWQKTISDPNGGKKDRPKEEHRAVIAHLLLGLVDALPPGEGAAPEAAAGADPWNNEAYRRFPVVVGLQSAVKEVNSQAKVLSGIRTELAQELAQERYNFAMTHKQVFNQLQQISEKVDRAQAEVARVQQQATAQATLVAKRKMDLANAQADLADARAVTTTRFQELTKMRDELFKIRVELRDATTENQNRARKIAELENKAAAQESTSTTPSSTGLKR